MSAARENLRTTRETIPVEGWQAVNDLYHYVNVESDRGADRRARDRFTRHVVSDSRRIDGILATTMSHDEAYAMWRLGRALERADMTTRVLGVRAAAVLIGAGGATGRERRTYEDLLWMGVLKSLSGLQMYRRAVRRPIEGPAVVRFLLEHDRFPRAVRALLREIRRALGELPDPSVLFDEVDAVDAVVARRPRTTSTVPRSTMRWRRCRAPSPSSTGGSTSATCGAVTRVSRPRHECRCRTPRAADAAIAGADPPAGRGRSCARRVSAGHLVHEMNVHRRPWRVDPVPFVLDGATFERLAAGVVERLRGDGADPRRPLRAAARSSPTVSSQARR